MSRARRCSVRITANLVEAVAEVINDGAGVARENWSGPAVNAAAVVPAARAPSEARQREDQPERATHRSRYYSIVIRP